MARWLLCFLVFLQVCFLVLSEETTTVSPSPQDPSASTESSSKAQTAASSALPSSVLPTRVPASTKTTPPPLDHANSSASMAPNANNKTENNNKNAALSVYSFNQIVMISMLGVLLSASAI